VTVSNQRVTDFIDGYSEKEDWTFANSDIHYTTHGFHPYPARMIPQVARKLIDMYATKKDNVVIDPYCGTGTTLVESTLKGISSIGVDSNPLAVLISKVKTTLIDSSNLSKERNSILARIKEDIEKKDDVEVPKIKNLDFWFKPSVSRKLAIIKQHIDQIDDPDIKDFFKVCFSSTVRKVSNTRPGEFKLYRISKEDLKLHRPKVYSVFWETVDKNVFKMEEFASLLSKKIKPGTYVIKGDTRKLLSVNPDIIHENCASLLITSPPYGDSHTTVAYGQFSRYPSAWLGFEEEEVWKLDKAALGGKVYDHMMDLGSPTLNIVINQISKIDEYRARETYAFFYDIDASFEQISHILKNGKSHVCYVLGKRTVKRVRIPADQILIELGSKYGFSHVTTKHRDIPQRRLPSRNAPEGVAAMKGEAMAKEDIIIWKY
jgi:DNA modification methylase